MIARAVALTGPPGSGKTTAGRLAAGRLGLDYFSVGELFREEARSRGMDLAEFSRYAEAHLDVDRALDRRMVEAARPGRILEGRIVGPLLRRARVPVLWLVVTARPEVRALRLAHRDGLAPEASRQAMEARETSERDRYGRAYGIDLSRETPDLTIDSSDLTAEEVADRLVAAIAALPAGPR